MISEAFMGVLSSETNEDIILPLMGGREEEAIGEMEVDKAI